MILLKLINLTIFIDIDKLVICFLYEELEGVLFELKESWT